MNVQNCFLQSDAIKMAECLRVDFVQWNFDAWNSQTSVRCVVPNYLKIFLSLVQNGLSWNRNAMKEDVAYGPHTTPEEVHSVATKVPSQLNYQKKKKRRRPRWKIVTKTRLGSLKGRKK